MRKCRRLKAYNLKVKYLLDKQKMIVQFYLSLKKAYFKK